jgi:hypothetical protein
MLENGKIRPLKKMNHHVVRKYEKDRRATVSQMNRVCVVDYRIVMTQSFTPRHPVPVANSLERGRFVIALALNNYTFSFALFLYHRRGDPYLHSVHECDDRSAVEDVKSLVTRFLLVH